jgi:hypothetical protein
LFKKGGGGKAYMNIKKFLGKAVPSYDFAYIGRVSIKNYILAICQMLMYEIGKRKSLWWVVRLLNKSK